MAISAAARAKRSAAAEAGALLLHDSTSLDFRFPRPRPGNPKHLEPNPLASHGGTPDAQRSLQGDGFLRPPVSLTGRGVTRECPVSYRRAVAGDFYAARRLLIKP
jgi:hypothetical protein